MTNTSRRTRQPAGAPTGGEFAPETRAETDVPLGGGPQGGIPQDAPVWPRGLRTALRLELAADPSTPREILAILSTDPDGQVRADCANNPNTPPAVLAALSTDPDGQVRTGCANNPNTPPAALAILSTDSDWRVRTDCSSNPNTPPEALAVLSTDSDWRVRRAVRDRQHTSQA